MSTTAIASLLPKPKNSSSSSIPSVPSATSIPSTSTSIIRSGPPPYRHRQNWLPRSLEDFGDGGAFPEISVAQYPLDMGKKKKIGSTSKALALQLDESGRVKYEAIARRGHSDDRVIYSQHKDLVPLDTKDNDQQLQRPSQQEIDKNIQRTREALDKIVAAKHQKTGVALATSTVNRDASYVRYTPQVTGTGEAGSTRIIRMMNVPEDPLEPPRFKHKKLPRGPGSPPAPVMHSPPRKSTAEEQKEWQIPPCISNWKNAKGYTIPLDKRLAADGRGLQEAVINDNFAKFAEALYIADRHAREEVEKRAQMQKKLAQKDKEAKEEHLRALAQKAREERAALAESRPPVESDSRSPSRSPPPRSRSRSRSRRRHSPSPRRPSTKHTEEEDDESYREREALRRDRERAIQRQIRMQHMGAETKARVTSRMLDRDVSEKIALGLVAPGAGGVGKEAMYDQRLFNQTQGLSSGFRDDDAYNLYDKPLFVGSSSASIYRPKNLDNELYGGVNETDVEKLLKEDRFVPDRGFSGAESAAAREGPVEFEKVEDPFGVNQFLEEATKGKRDQDEPSGSSSKRQKK